MSAALSARVARLRRHDSDKAALTYARPAAKIPGRTPSPDAVAPAHLAEVVADGQQRALLLAARGDVDVHAKHLRQLAAAIDREQGAVDPQPAAVGGLHQPVARGLG